LRVSKIGGLKSTVVVYNAHGVQENADSWPLIDVFKTRIENLHSGFRFDIFLPSYIGLGMGSSGAGAVLLLGALAIVENRFMCDLELIHEAHYFESHLAMCPCGPQDHTIATLGGLRLIEYPSLDHKKIDFAPVWESLTVWKSDGFREARLIIPEVLSQHTELIWNRKKLLATTIAESFSRGDIRSTLEGVRNEYEIQKELRMVTELQAKAVEAVIHAGGAAKISGAGGGGVVVAIGTNDTQQASIRSILKGFGYSPIPLSIDNNGLLIEPSDMT
jgi:mevalonate kinase